MADKIDTLRVVLDARARLGEGPCWDSQAERLYWVDIYNHRVHEFDPANGLIVSSTSAKQSAAWHRPAVVA